MRKEISDKLNAPLIILNSNDLKYCGKYVALRKFVGNEERDVLAFGDDFADVLKRAKKKRGSLIIIYIPNSDEKWCYVRSKK